jgi:DNA-binding MarR family transcriptional regulator
MSAAAFNPVIHAPIRLQTCAILASADKVEFVLLRDALEVSDSVLSKHLKQLEEAGFVRLHKVPTAGRVKTWLSLTGTGRNAFAAHVRELQRLASSSVLATGAATTAV